MFSFIYLNIISISSLNVFIIGDLKSLSLSKSKADVFQGQFLRTAFLPVHKPYFPDPLHVS